MYLCVVISLVALVLSSDVGRNQPDPAAYWAIIVPQETQCGPIQRDSPHQKMGKIPTEKTETVQDAAGWVGINWVIRGKDPAELQTSRSSAGYVQGIRL